MRLKESMRTTRNSEAKRRLVRLKSIESAFEEGKPERAWILKQLSGLVNYARIRVMDSNTAADERIKWSRILISAAISCSYALRDKQIDDLKDEVKLLKTLVKEITEEEQDEEEEAQEKAEEREETENTVKEAGHDGEN